jgi:hypothetical protein
MSYVLHNPEFFPVVEKGFLWFGNFALVDPTLVAPLAMGALNYLWIRVSYFIRFWVIN